MTISEAELGWLEEYVEQIVALCTSGSPVAADAVQQLARSARNRFGELHPHIGATLCVAGTGSLFIPDFEASEKWFKEARRAADVATSDFELDLIHTAALTGLLAVFLNARNFDEATYYASKLEDLLDRSECLADEIRWQALLVLGEMYFLQEKYDQADLQFVNAGILLNSLPQVSDHYSRLAYIHARIAVTEYLRGNTEKSLEIFESVLAMRDQLNLPLTELFLACSNMAGMLLQQAGDTSKAEVYLNFALAGTQDVYGVHNPLSVESTNYLANYFLNLQDWSKAFEYLQESISYIDKRIDTEQTMWVLDNLISITSLLDNYELQGKYVDTLTDLYTREYNGDFMSDRSLVEKGDKGAALKRQEKFQKTINSVKQRYDADIHPQAAASLKNIDPRVWTAPILEASRRYGLHVLDSKTTVIPAAVPEQSVLERDGLIKAAEERDAEQDDSEQENVTWQSAVEAHIAAKNHPAALGLLEAFMQLEAHHNGPHSPGLIPFLETQANIYSTTGKSDAARPLEIRARLLSVIP